MVVAVDITGGDSDAAPSPSYERGPDGYWRLTKDAAWLSDRCARKWAHYFETHPDAAQWYATGYWKAQRLRAMLRIQGKRHDLLRDPYGELIKHWSSGEETAREAFENRIMRARKEEGTEPLKEGDDLPSYGGLRATDRETPKQASRLADEEDRLAEARCSLESSHGGPHQDKARGRKDRASHENGSVLPEASGLKAWMG